MSLVKTLLLKIGRLLLNIVRVLRKAVCCRRKRQESEYLLPMTVGHVISMGNEDSDLQSWETWNESENSSSSLNSGERSVSSDDDPAHKVVHPDESDAEDFFKDMVPQIRKPKKIFVRETRGETEQTRNHSSRLAMDPKAILTGPDLGLIDDNPTNWEDSENLEEVWDPDVLIREKRHAEREMRLAEHQRRKQEKENKRFSREIKNSFSPA